VFAAAFHISAFKRIARSNSFFTAIAQAPRSRPVFYLYFSPIYNGKFAVAAASNVYEFSHGANCIIDITGTLTTYKTPIGLAFFQMVFPSWLAFPSIFDFGALHGHPSHVVSYVVAAYA